MTQNEKVLALLRANPQGITPLDALEFHAGLRLAARINDLRARGHEIVTERTPGGYARYRLVEKAQRELWQVAS